MSTAATVVRAVTTFAVLATLGEGAEAQSAHYRHEGVGPNLGMGFMVERLGDIDEDGVDDYYVSTRLQNTAEIRSGANGTLIRRHDQYLGCFGMDVATMGDLDGDGVSDYAIGAPRDFGLGPQAGNVRVFSGKTGGLMYLIPNLNPTGRFGLRIDHVEDLNGDGHRDLVIGAHWDSTNAFHSGAAFVHSGIDGANLFAVYGDSEDDIFGITVTGLGDMNGDGVPDFAVGCPREYTDQTSSPAGYVRIYSGVDGRPLANIDGYHADDDFGIEVEGIEDVTGDGIDDFLIGATGYTAHGVRGGLVELRSGADNSVVRRHRGTQDSQYGVNVRSVPDFDGDGLEDIIIGACFCVGKVNTIYPGDGWVEVLSGATGDLITTVSGADGTRFGYRADGIGDINGDGIPDFVVSNNNTDEQGAETGSAWVFSAEDLPMRSDRHEVSIATGADVVFEIEAGRVNAGANYYVFGSFTGTSPGVPVSPSVHLPLNWDAYTNITLGFGSAPGFMFWGTLDGTGSAVAGLQVPAGLAATLVGLELHHAYLLDRGFGFDFVSNAVPLTLLP